MLDILAAFVIIKVGNTLLSWKEANIMDATLYKSTFTDDAKVMSKGQVTIPKDVREVLGVGNGDRVTFVVDHGKVTVVNSAIFAMKYLQEQLKGEAEKLGLESEQDKGEAEKLGLESEQDVNNLMKSIRDED